MSSRAIFIMLRAPSTCSGNANSSECWSPLMSGSANADGTSKMLSCQNMFMAKGKLVLAPNLSNKRCSCCGSQPDEYRLPVASIRNCDSLSAPPTPATTEKFNKRAQDKQPSSEVIELVEEWGRGENQMAKEVSLYQPEMKRLRSDRDIPVLYEETPDRLIRVENSSTDRETKAIDLLGTPNKKPQRKKHKPKVFKEGKPSRTPKLATSPSDMDGSSCKRKYVRRNKDVIHSSEKENTSCRRKYARRSKDVAHSSNTNAFEEIIETESKSKAKYSRRCLNFDSEEPQAMEEFSAAMLVFKKVLGDRSHHEVANCHPQNALVPYARHEFMMVPYDRSFELVKRRRPRAKVDLDPESNRVWKLLMGKDCGEGGEPPDVDKEKWWDEERRVFQGRVDSFIARMHFVQGDRRYSQWKGSVVDSVVGVFLTQNVSDHLSSSAFMSLAANFPHSSRDKFSVPETERVNTSMESQNISLFDNGLFFQSSVEFSGSQNGEGKEISNCSEILRSTTRSSIIYYSRQKGKGKCVNHKNIASDAKDTSKNENLEVRVSLEKELMTRFQQKDKNSIFKEVRTRDSVQPSDEPCGNQQAAVSNNQIECNFDMPDRVGPNLKVEICNFPKTSPETANSAINTRKTEKSTYDWESLRKEVCCSKSAEERNSTTMDSLDWEAVRTADVSKVAEAIRARGMNNVLAERIQAFLNRLLREHGSIDLEWLRDVSPDKVKDYLLSIRGLGLKSAECVCLLTLRQLAFPVDTNVGRICVRLGWVPLQPLPESLQLHLLELYPVLDTIQKYLWPRLCKLDQLTLYELHYQMITFGKVFCTKSKPNCNSCPMRGECRHFASAFASARLALPAPEDKSLLSLASPIASDESANAFLNPRPFPQIEESLYSQEPAFQNNCVPIIEEPASPEPECQESLESAIEDAFYEDPEEIPTIKLNLIEFTQNLRNCMEENMELQDGRLSKALVTLSPEAASIPMPKLKNVSRLRTEHQVYEIPDIHPLLEGLDPREPDDPSPYLLAIWTPGETTQSTEPPKADCNFEDVGQPCERSTCFGCNSMREEESHKIRGTLLIPCRTAMRGSFPLNGTYFQVNEVFADHQSSREPVHVLRDWIWNLPRRTVYFGTSIPTIFKGLTTEGIQQCFWRGFVCVRGFDRVTRAPKPLYVRLHFPASKTTKNRNVGEPKAEKNSSN